MKILIDPEIKSSIEETDKVWLEILFPTDKEFNATFVDIDYVKKFNYLEMADNAFKRCKSIQYRVENKEGKVKLYKFASKTKAKFISATIKPLGVRTKTSKFPKKQFFSAVDQLIEKSKKIDDSLIGTKSLVYYSVYFEGDYLTLLNLSIESLLKHEKKPFDILIITDKATKPHIEALSFARKITPLFHITETPKDGIEASINKLEVFNFSQIDEYNRILYLDADIIANSSIKNIFKQKYKSDVFYTASNHHLTYEHFKTHHHGFNTLTKAFIEEMRSNHQMPFNAGQFFFYNTKRMKTHFDNVKWMIANWSGEYFFEQCFMNYYFCKASITNNKLLTNIVSFIVTTDASTENIQLTKPLTHFIAPPLNGGLKVKFINQVISNHNNHLHNHI